DLAAMERAICPETAVVSVMYANNEIGTLQPIRQAAAIAHSHGVLFHTDAVQAYGQIPIDPGQLRIDLMSASGHKLNGPKGIGFLYVRKGLDITSIIRGGSQERGKRAGTENVPGIVGMGCAARISNQMMRQKIQRETALRDYMIRRLLREIPDLKLNGSARMRLPNNINCCICGVNGGALVALMDLEGICISAASACSAGSRTPSHVQLAIGNTPAEAQTAIRITLGYQTTREEIDIAADTLKRLVTKLRTMT
ncbi:MAG: aminotransferase class V-fold PLP-dependent enzyme, partial [Clostridiales bacterium]|nr:aminotransferase class V-fold PLP-dependent enzyme [Clostridiales bacterium]